MIDQLSIEEANYHQGDQVFRKKSITIQAENSLKPKRDNLLLMHENYQASLPKPFYVDFGNDLEQSHLLQVINLLKSPNQAPQNSSKSSQFTTDSKKEGNDQQKRKQRNNNSIKKLGRIIMDHIKQYSRDLKPNFGVIKMMKMLNRDSRHGRFEFQKRDKFNTYHLNELLNSNDSRTNCINKRITRKLLCTYLRKNVLFSLQISQQSKLIYLNSLKCSALRCCNGYLAVRLQMTS